MPAVSELQTIFVMVMNTVTDFYLMAIPLPASSMPDPDPLWLPLMRLFSAGYLGLAVTHSKEGGLDPHV